MMNENFDEWIGKYLPREADTQDMKALEREMESNAALREQFLISQRIWQNSHISTGDEWDVEKGWQKFSDNIKGEVFVKAKTRNLSRTLAMAAALVLSLGVAFYLWSVQKPVVYTFNQENTQPLILLDGSKVYLNEGASVTVHSFKKKKRQVELEGEAFFEVSTIPNKPFTVSAGGTTTEVVGTTFNIAQAKDHTTIFVKEGKVIFRSQKNENVAVALTSGEAAVFQKGKVDRIVNPSPNMHAWHSKELSFINMPLSAVISDISSYFKKHDISIESDKVKNCRIYIPLSFKEPEIDSVLHAVALAINADIFMDGEKCIIRGGNCAF